MHDLQRNSACQRWVVKVGGSLCSIAGLKGMLKVLVEYPGLVIVPGGGPFADQVRTMHQRWKFDDSTAHHMALLAMEQFGLMLCSLQPGFEPAASLSAVEAIIQRGRTPVWMPEKMVMQQDAIAHSWDVTSDSLAAWLAGQLHSDALLLIKTAPVSAREEPIQAAIDQGLLDPAFGHFAQAAGVPVWLLSERDQSKLGQLLAGNVASAARLLPTVVSNELA